MLCHKCNGEVDDSAILCEHCGEVLKDTSRDATERHCRRINVRRLVVIGVAALVFLVGAVGMLIGFGPTAVAKRYVTAQIEGDIKEVLSMTAGDMQGYLEARMSGALQEELFQSTEATAASLGLDLSVENFSQYYKATKAIAKAACADTYGADYTITVTVKETEEMSVQDFTALQTAYDTDAYRDYIDADSLRIGKLVILSVTIEGSKAVTHETIVPMVQYKGFWKVIAIPESLN